MTDLGWEMCSLAKCTHVHSAPRISHSYYLILRWPCVVDMTLKSNYQVSNLASGTAWPRWTALVKRPRKWLISNIEKKHTDVWCQVHFISKFCPLYISTYTGRNVKVCAGMLTAEMWEKRKILTNSSFTSQHQAASRQAGSWVIPRWGRVKESHPQLSWRSVCWAVSYTHLTLPTTAEV